MRGSHVTGSDLGERSKSLWWEEDEAGVEYGAWRHCPSLKRHDDKSGQGNWHRQRKAHGAYITGWIEPLFKNSNSFFNAWAKARSYYKTSESHSVVSNSLRPHGLYSSWNSPGQHTGVGNISPLQEIFPTQGLNPGLPHCRRILYQLSHKGSLRILEWVAYPFSSSSSQPRNWTGVSCIAGGFFTSWATREAQVWILDLY